MPAHLAEIRDALGFTIEEARSWRERVFARAAPPIRSETGLIRAAIEKELAQRSKPARTGPVAKSAKKKGSRSAAKGASTSPTGAGPSPKRPSNVVRRSDEAGVRAALAAGESHASIAERTHTHLKVVERFDEDTRRSAALDAVEQGEAVEAAAARFRVDRERLARIAEHRARARVPAPAPARSVPPPAAVHRGPRPVEFDVVGRPLDDTAPEAGPVLPAARLDWSNVGVPARAPLGPEPAPWDPEYPTWHARHAAHHLRGSASVPTPKGA